MLRQLRIVIVMQSQLMKLFRQRTPMVLAEQSAHVVKFLRPCGSEITADNKPLTIKLTDSLLHLCVWTPSSLSNVKSSEYVGVISKKQADGPDQAIQVLILPEELRGLNQGSFMLPPDKDAESGGRMTNGSASDVASSSGSRMSNGSVSDADTASITLQYAGHSRTVCTLGVHR